MPVTRSHRLTPVGLLGLVVALGCGSRETVTDAGTNPGPSMVARADLDDGSRAPALRNLVGVVVAKRAVDVVAPATGRIRRLSAQVGQRVAVDAVLASLDPRLLARALTMKRSSLAEARATRAGAEAELADAKAQLARWQRIREQATDEGMAMLALRVDKAAALVEQARAKEDSETVALNNAEEDLATADIRAPFGGVVSVVYVSAGQDVAERAPLVRLVDPGSLVLRFAVPQESRGAVQPGDKVVARTEGDGSRLVGVVTSVAPELEPASQMVLVEAGLAPLELSPSALGGDRWTRTLSLASGLHVLVDAKVDP